MKKMDMRQMTLVGLMTAVLCILGPLSITLPFTPIPISFTNLGIYFIIFILGWKLSTMSVVVYILLGMVGLPVFSGFSGGAAKVAGPTGGYLIGFIFMAIIAGWFVERFEGKILMYMIGMVVATAVTYAFGTAWLCVQMHLTPIQGLTVGVLPYIPGDIVKMIVGILVGSKVKKAVRVSAVFES
ncbi:MAG: biotin transporter BioY [Anaerostipes sp.]|jgi:biotin transport system substrate-specific component|nr:biotin transporter BioY [Anaerostipes sp.]MDD3744861.1 biotin transporter BioY [Anaerostipes sp.]